MAPSHGDDDLPERPPHSFVVGDRVEVAVARHNVLHHEESYSVGERGEVLKACARSSVVQVRLEGDYEIVESVLPLVKRKVPHRVVSASVLHLIRERPRAATRAIAWVKPVDTGPEIPRLLPVEEGWLRAIFKRLDTGSDSRVNWQELVTCCECTPLVAAFFGVQNPTEPDSLDALKGLFMDIAGKDEQISWAEFCDFYKRRLRELADPASAGLEEAKEPSDFEVQKLHEAFSSIEADMTGRICKGDFIKAISRLSDDESNYFFGCREEIRKKALEDVTKGVSNGIAHMIGGYDGEITFAEVCDFCMNTDGKGPGLSMAERQWLDGLFKRFHGAVGASESFNAREGEYITKQQLITACQEAPETALLFGLKRNIEQKSLPAATRDALGAILKEAGTTATVRISWEDVLRRYSAAVCGVGAGTE